MIQGFGLLLCLDVTICRNWYSYLLTLILFVDRPCRVYVVEIMVELIVQFCDFHEVLIGVLNTCCFYLVRQFLDFSCCFACRHYGGIAFFTHCHTLHFLSVFEFICGGIFHLYCVPDASFTQIFTLFWGFFTHSVFQITYFSLYSVPYYSFCSYTVYQFRCNFSLKKHTVFQIGQIFHLIY